jgi:hypothetical protein
LAIILVRRNAIKAFLWWRASFLPCGQFSAGSEGTARIRGSRNRIRFGWEIEPPQRYPSSFLVDQPSHYGESVEGFGNEFCRHAAEAPDKIRELRWAKTGQI